MNCSSSGGSTLALFCLNLYFFSHFLLLFLLNISSSASVYRVMKKMINIWEIIEKKISESRDQIKNSSSNNQPKDGLIRSSVNIKNKDN
jgi:hypothetical protein